VKTDIPLVQAGFFRPILETLDSTGVSTATLLRNTSLHRFDLSNNENYVPVELMYRLFDEIKRREGIDDFLEVFANQIRAQGMCDWLDVVAYSPDLLSALTFTTEYEDVVLTHQRIRLDIDGPVSKFSMQYLDHKQYHERPHQGFAYTDYADFCLGFNFFKQVGGLGWEPLEIHLQALEAPNFDKLLPSGSQTKIYLGQPATSYVFPTAMLSIPLQVDGSVGDTERFEKSPQSMSGIIEKLLSSARDGQVGNLELVADMLSLSPRTLRRRLVDEGKTFTEIVDTWRFKSSLDLLGQDNSRIHEIADRLGYANAPNFERAFKRWTGQTPGTYRETLSS
jgi:AraC-like DNA-binding protein